MGRAPRSARRSREKITVEKLCSSVRDVITGRQSARGVLSAGNDYFVRKSAQGRGIGIALSNRWADEVDVALAPTRRYNKGLNLLSS